MEKKDQKASLTFSDFSDLANHYDYFLLDCDGVLWLGEKPIAHSFPALDYLISKNKKVFLLTNGTQRSR